ncbi:MAG: metallophosphoesterase [Clostridia bacterium]|nr:metallophosphoesterase [Clostridia bacterium]
MIKKILSVVITLVIAVEMLSVMSFAEDFTPKLRFVVASDVHLADSGSDLEEARLKKLFETSYAYAETQSYKRVDGAFFVGDISDRGTSSSMDKFFRIVNENKRSETVARAILGNHEFYTESSRTVSRFLTSSGYAEADTDFVLGGYHFIMMCPQNGGRGYTSTQRKWLDKRLSEDAREDATGRKPIFVFQHHNVSGTVYGSAAWGISELSSILSSYPQVVDFSGHSHYPINDPRSIWQGRFTALNDGTLSYYEMGIAGVADGGVYPSDNYGGYAGSRNHRDAAQYYIVEVDNNNAIRVKGYDLLSDTFICEYNIPSVGNVNEFVYTDARKSQSTPPQFDPSATITLKGARADAAVFQIPQAKSFGDDVVQHYRFDVYDKANNLVSTEYALSDTFFFPAPETIRCVVSGLQKSTDYYVKCYAVNCWGKESAPLTLNFSTVSGTEKVTCYNSPVTPNVFSFIQLENGAAYDGVSGRELSRDGEPVPYTDDITGRCAAEFNGKNSYGFDGFKEKYGMMQNGVSFEFYGELDDIDFKEGCDYVDVLSNQEGGGCGLELTKDGNMEFYVYVGGRYVHPGTKVEFNQPVHIVGTFDGQYVKVYINGVLSASERASGTLSFPSGVDAQFLCVGGDSNNNGSAEARFTGKIVTANVYGKALTDYEIEQLSNQYDTFDFISESGYQFNLNEKLLYGLNLTALSGWNIKKAFRNNNLFVESDNIGTGTKIVLKDRNGNVYDTAEVVIFGDVNGDGWYDCKDSVIVNCIAKGILSRQQVGEAVYKAADCNHDGAINESDVVILQKAGLLLSNVDQTKPVSELSANADFCEYISLIEQTVDFAESAEETAPQNAKCIITMLFNFIVKIINCLMRIFIK